MPKEKVTLTLDAANLAELRERAGRRSLSASVDAAVAEYVHKLRHFAAVDEWLYEMEQEHGPIPPETQEWADRIFDEWEAGNADRRAAG